MSVVASLELCRELYELSGWKDTPLLLVIGTTLGGAPYSDVVKRGDYEAMGYVNVSSTHPAYDLGYLLRNLPIQTVIKKYQTSYGCLVDDINTTGSLKGVPLGHADTPEDAACRLAIELFKRGILK